MKYRALFVGGPLDGQERVTEQTLDHIYVEQSGPVETRRGCLPPPQVWTFDYMLLFGYGENTLVYSTRNTSGTLDILFDRYMEDDETLL